MANESLALNSLELNDGVIYSMLALEMPDPKKRAEWASSGDSDGAALVRDPLFDNRTITAKVRVRPQTTMNLALDKIGAIGDKLEEAERREQNNLMALVWTPHTSARTLTFYVLSGEFEELPRQKDDAGWFQFSPVITLRLDCLPAGYEAEATVTAASSTAPLQEFIVADVRGDMAAEARLIVTDAATQNRRHVEFGMENVNYVAGTSLTLDSDSMTVSGFAGAQTTRSGSYDPNASGNNVIRGTLVNTAQAIVGTGNLGHIGSYKVKARVWASSLGVQLRFAYRDGDGALRRLPWVTPPVEDAFAEVELGEISIAKAASGTQRWSGQVEAKSSTVLDTLDVDYLLFIPTERYGIARAPKVTESGVVAAYDSFNQSAGALATKSPDVGAGTWSGAGDATDFTVDATNHYITRAEVSDAANTGRWARLGTTVPTTTTVQTDVAWSAVVAINRMGVFARYVDTNNWLFGGFTVTSGGGGGAPTARLVLEKRVAGTITTLAGPVSGSYAAGSWFTIRLYVGTDGAIQLYAVPQGAALGSPAITFAGGTDFTSGGALDDGGFGIYDAHTSASAVTRQYDNFYVETSGVAVDAACFSAQSIEFRSEIYGSDAAIREDSGGTVYGQPRIVRGSRFYIPCSGSADRDTRVAVLSRRNDITLEESPNIADNQTVEVRYRARHLHVPRA